MDYTVEQRMKKIDKWNRDYEKSKENEKRKKETAEAKINFILLQQKYQEQLKEKEREKEAKDNKETPKDTSKDVTKKD